MREVITDIERWRQSEEPVALATVVMTWGSAPRGVGSKMAMTASGKISGSVSGGCVEGAVYSSATEALEQEQPTLLAFGVADETAWEVGLACGGQIEVFVEPLHAPTFDRATQWLADEESGAIVTVVKGPDSHLGRKLLVNADGVCEGSIDPALDEEIRSLTAQAIKDDRPARHVVGGPQHELDIFIDVIVPQPLLILVGGAHIAIALTTIANAVGYRTVVIDPRRAFGSAERFPHVDRLIQAWPKEAFKQVKLTGSTAVAMLSHDPKIDDPALEAVLPGPAFYVGALGSSRTHAKRRKRLLDSGMPQQLVDSIHSPIGLDIKAETPEEIAVAVMAEIVAARHGDS